jgi:hypothetical protein
VSVISSLVYLKTSLVNVMIRSSQYELNILTHISYLVSHCLQPADRWGMKLVGTPCGNSVWVTEGEAEEAVLAKGMDAVNAARWASKVATP